MRSGISLDQLRSYRQRTFHTLPQLIIKTVEQAVDFVNERGFVFFWPIKDLLLPSLWVAVAGDRPIPDDHDDPGHITWNWKDSLLGKRRWYYARVLRHRNTIISLEIAPYFYALSQNYGDPENDHLILYEEGLLTQEAKSVYEALLREGPLDTIALRKAAHLSSRDSDTRFNKALGQLQEDFKILPIGTAEVGAWHYAFIYDLTARHFPNLPEQARPISERQAQRKLLELYFQSVGAAELKDCVRCFRWKEDVIQRVVGELVENGSIYTEVGIPSLPGSWIVSRDVMTE
jgi:hypothetical protein